MSLGNNDAERDLIRHLADTLVENEVMKPMDTIGWGHGTPPPPATATTAPTEGAPAPAATPAPGQPSGPPASAAPVKPAAPASAPANAPDLFTEMESLRDPQSGMILGKYKDANEAIKGVGHAVQMAKTAFTREKAALDEAATLRVEIERLRTQPATPVAAPSTTFTAPSAQKAEEARAAYDEVLSKVVESGGVLDEENSKRLSEAQRNLSRAEARMAAEELLHAQGTEKSQEQKEWEQVDQFMQQNFPDSLNFTDEIGLHIRSNPLLSDAVTALIQTGQKQKASVYAWQSYQAAVQSGQAATERAAAVGKEEALAAKAQVRQELVDAARKDAGIVSGSAGGHGVHERPDAGATQEQIQMAMDGMRRMGDSPGSAPAQVFRDLVIGPSLDPAIFGE